MRVGKACEWRHPRASTVRLLSRNEGVTPTILTFPQETKVGSVITLAPPLEDEEWEELGEIVLRAEEEEEGQSKEGEEGGPGQL